MGLIFAECFIMVLMDVLCTSTRDVYCGLCVLSEPGFCGGTTVIIMTATVNPRNGAFSCYRINNQQIPNRSSHPLIFMNQAIRECSTSFPDTPPRLKLRLGEELRRRPTILADSLSDLKTVSRDVIKFNCRHELGMRENCKRSQATK